MSGQQHGKRAARPAFHDSCAHCGAILNGDDWYPVVTITATHNGPNLYSFCDEDCQAAWEPP